MMKTNINNIHLGFDLLGEIEPPIVLIHGFGLDRSIWRPLALSHLGNQMVILPDMRGHGESDAPRGPYRMSLLAEDLALLLESLGINKAIVCGHSMGGYVALAFANQYPQMLMGLGLITTNANADPEDKRAGRYALIQEIRERGAIVVADNLAPRLSDDQVVVNQAHALISKTNPEGLIGALAGMAERPDRAARLLEIDVPSLVVAGEVDRITVFTEAKAMAEALPKGHFLGIRGVGHMPMAEAPEVLADGLCTLIRRVMR
jgi:3-oxoadipate enol-lactonase